MQFLQMELQNNREHTTDTRSYLFSLFSFVSTFARNEHQRIKSEDCFS